jgi:hypothetical protein
MPPRVGAQDNVTDGDAAAAHVAALRAAAAGGDAAAASAALSAAAAWAVPREARALRCTALLDAGVVGALVALLRAGAAAAEDE